MKVLIATDGTPTAIHAIETAMRLLPLERAGVYLVSVSDPSNGSAATTTPTVTW